jgi:hypothetical protein
MSERPAFPEPFKLWKSRDRSTHVRVEISEHQGRCLLNVRIWQTGSDGIDRPTIKGIALAIRKLPDLADGINKMLAKARAIGLLDDDEATS